MAEFIKTTKLEGKIKTFQAYKDLEHLSQPIYPFCRSYLRIQTSKVTIKTNKYDDMGY